jgi:hypothetical protein
MAGRVDSSWEEDNARQCSNCTRVFPWFIIQHNVWSFEVSESAHGGCPGNWRIEKKRTEWVCPSNISYGMQMKEEICLTGLWLGTNHGCITTNPNQSVLQCNGNNLVHFQPKSVRLRHQLGRLCLPYFGILREYCYPIFRSVMNMWILHHTVKFCWRLGMKFAENVQANCFILKMPDPIQPEQSRR